jgi:hypothetical protein
MLKGMQIFFFTKRGKRMKRTLEFGLLVAIAMLIMLGEASAAIRRIGLNQTYTTITAAYTAAVNDDTLLISPGVYSETITSTKRLHWIGAGFDVATINGRIILNVGSTGTNITGLQISSSVNDNGCINVAGGVDLVSIERCLLYNNWDQDHWKYCVYRTGSPGGTLNIEECILLLTHNYNNRPIYLNGDIATIRNCVIARRFNTDHTTNIPVSGSAQALIMDNCTLLGWNIAFYFTNSFPVFTVRNNIFYDWTASASWGTYPGGGAGWSYNSSSILTPPGTNGLLLVGDPFVNYDETANYIYGSSNLHLPVGSPCINAGDPAILDFLDGSRSDMGAYGGPTPHVDGGAPNYPFTIQLDVPQSMFSGQQLPIQAMGRIGAGY